MIKVLFICLGNICRSPTAHGVFEGLVTKRKLSEFIQVDSAGTSAWHVGDSPDTRSLAVAKNRGYDLSYVRARQVNRNDFSQFDYILAMDEKNLADLNVMCPDGYSGELALLLSYGAVGENELEVPDPYFGEGDGFEHVLSLVEHASKALLDYITDKHGLTP
jgi:protein-tyrosine phosphatase